MKIKLLEIHTLRKTHKAPASFSLHTWAAKEYKKVSESLNYSYGDSIRIINCVPEKVTTVFTLLFKLFEVSRIQHSPYTQPSHLYEVTKVHQWEFVILFRI